MFNEFVQAIGKSKEEPRVLTSWKIVQTLSLTFDERDLYCIWENATKNIQDNLVPIRLCKSKD